MNTVLGTIEMKDVPQYCPTCNAKLYETSPEEITLHICK